MVLKDVGFSLKTGDILGLFGRNGSGKSTLLKMIFGTLKGESIKMSLDGSNVIPSEIIPKKLIAYIPQHSYLPLNARVRDIIPMYFSEGKKQDPIFYDSTIASFASLRIHQLSYGQRKYFEIVLSCHLPHPFIMIDEPFSMLEPLQKESLKLILKEISIHKGILLTDHYYSDVLDIATKKLVLKDGLSFSISTEEDLRHFEYLSKKN